MQKIAILYDASQAVLSTFVLDEVLARILSILRDYFHLHRGAILLPNEKTRRFEVHAEVGSQRRCDARGLALGEGLAGTAAKLKRPIYAPDVTRDPRYIMNVPSTRSELAVPLMVRDEVVGVLDCQSDIENFFDSDTIDLLMLFSTQASIALQNARLYTLEQRRREQLEAINRIAQQTTSVLDLRELLQKACRYIVEAFRADHVSILLLDGARLVLRAQEGKLTLRLPGDLELPAGVGLSARALRTLRSVVVNDVAQTSDYIAGFEETRSEMCVPLVCFGETLGVLVLDSAQTDAFEPADLQPIESVADICANAIQNARYVEKVRQLADVDGLTAAFNRRYFETRIVQEIERARRYQAPFSILMVDLDHFKRVNDEFGHLLGDEVLRQVSGIFAHHLRKIDVVCRYGGEEFAILLLQTATEGASQVADKLRRIIETFRFPGVPRSVTVSIGVAEFPLTGGSRDELVRAADNALYAAKQSGRNCVTRAPAATAASVE